MKASHPLFAPVLRAIAMVAAGAVLLGCITKVVHEPHNPYYAQLAAKAAKSEAQKKTGDKDGYVYTGNDSQ